MGRGEGEKGTVLCDWLLPIVSAIGDHGFIDSLFTVLNRDFLVDHVVVHTFTEHSSVGTFATVGRIPAPQANRLARDYSKSDWFRRDPNLSHILATGKTPVPISASLTDRLYTQQYRTHFFDAANIVDKVAIAVRMSDGCRLCLNFHRLADTGRFKHGTRETLLRRGVVMAAALARHRDLSISKECLDASGPGLGVLTPRERDVCSGILSGVTSEGIASRLGISKNTVLTLRRRAYARLGITSQNELVKLSFVAR